MLRKFTAAGFCIGVGVRVMLMLVYWIILHPLHVFVAAENRFETVQLVLWPSSFWLMASRGMDLASLSILGLAVATNGIFYAFLGLLALVVRNTVRHFASQHRDGRSVGVGPSLKAKRKP